VIDRRRFLQGGLALGAGAVLLGPRSVRALADPATDDVPRSLARSAATGEPFVVDPLFTDGVLSGDSTPRQVVLWTRIEPSLDRREGLPVGVEVARDPEFSPSGIAAFATVEAVADNDHTVRLDVDGLQPGTTYYYRFTVRGHQSPIGRTKTAPEGGIDRARIGFFSCQRYTHGYFGSHRDMAELALDPETDLDVVLSLGDYVYNTEYADDWLVPGRDRPAEPEALDRQQYRERYHAIRYDPDLQAMHANHPVVCVFDNHDGMSDRSDPQAAGAVPAFFEQLPVRRFGSSDRIHRRFSWGDRLEVFMMDQRQHRDPSLDEDPDNFLGTSSEDQPAMFDPDRTMLGAEQREWLLGGLAASTAQWKVLGSQLMFWPWRSEAPGGATEDAPHPGRYLNLVQWDGYQAERDAILGAIREHEVDDVIVVSGDSHVWSAAEVSADWDDADSPPLLVELNGSSITSANADERGIPGTDITRPLLTGIDPYMRYFQSERHGYGVVEVAASGAELELRSPTSITDPEAAVEVLASFRVDSGTARMQRTGGTDEG
jgi:alkaline phosphatase D